MCLVARPTCPEAAASGPSLGTLGGGCRSAFSPGPLAGGGGLGKPGDSSSAPGPFPDVISRFREKMERLEPDVYAVLRLEREERELQRSEAQVRGRGGGRVEGKRVTGARGWMDGQHLVIGAG